MLHVVIDTNSLGIRAPLAGNAERLLLAAAEKGQLVLVVPELVVREVVNKWRELVDKERDRLQSAVRELVKYDITVVVPTDEERDALAGVMEAKLREELSAPGVLVADFPTTPHERFVSRALARRQPFDRAGKDGYRDALLWETVVELAGEHEVVLVSRDARAFADGDGELAQVLKAEATERAGVGANVTLMGDPHDVVALLAQQDQATLEQVRKLARQRSFRVLLEEALDDALAIYPLDRSQRSRLGPPGTVTDAWTRDLQQMGNATVQSAYTVPGGEALVQLDVLCGVGLVFQASGADAYELLGDDVWTDDDIVWGVKESVALTTVRLATVGLDVAVALPAGRLVRLAVVSVTLADVDVEFEPAEVEDDEPQFDADEPDDD